MSPSSPHPDELGHRRGRNIEDKLLADLEAARQAGHLRAFGQSDAWALTWTGDLYLIECKGQDSYKAPPFDGHGLPVAQAERYALVHEQAGIRTWFVVHDEFGRCDAWLDALERGPHFNTAGTVKTPRRIYPLANFRRIPLERAA